MGEVAEMLAKLDRANGGPTKGRKILIVGRDCDPILIAEAMNHALQIEMQGMRILNSPATSNARGPRNRWGALR